MSAVVVIFALTAVQCSIGNNLFKYNTNNFHRNNLLEETGRRRQADHTDRKHTQQWFIRPGMPGTLLKKKCPTVGQHSQGSIGWEAAAEAC